MEALGLMDENETTKKKVKHDENEKPAEVLDSTSIENRRKNY